MRSGGRGSGRNTTRGPGEERRKKCENHLDEELLLFG
jgi:hypothetical protein